MKPCPARRIVRRASVRVVCVLVDHGSWISREALIRCGRTGPSATARLPPRPNRPHGPASRPRRRAWQRGRRAYGHAVFAKTVDESSFPLAVERYREEYGAYPVRIDTDRVVSAADILENVGREEFDSLGEFYRAIGEAMRAGGYWPADID